MKYLWQYKNARWSAYIVLSELKLNKLEHRLKSVDLTWIKTWTWRQRLYVWRKPEYVRTKMRPVQGVSWILRHDKTWQNSHQWNARSKQQNGRLAWSSCDVRTRISSNLIKQSHWEENYGKKFLLAGLNRSVQSCTTQRLADILFSCTDEFSSNFDRILKKQLQKPFRNSLVAVLIGWRHFPSRPNFLSCSRPYLNFVMVGGWSQKLSLN